MKRIAFVGGPSTGKSVTSAEVFVAFKKMGVVTEYVPEWIRRDISRNGHMESIWEQFRTLIRHREEEDDFPDAVEYVVVDSGVLTPFFYSAVYGSKEDIKDRLVIQDMYRYMLDDLYKKRYEHVFFMPRAQMDREGVSFLDGVRYSTPEEITALEDFMSLIFTRVHRVSNVHVLDCPLRDRVERVIGVVFGEEGLKKFEAVKQRESA